MEMTWAWAMPNKETFKCQPIGDFVERYLSQSEVSVDPFARDFQEAIYTNDLNPNTEARWHMDAVDFLRMLCKQKVQADLVIFDPPFSPTQLKRCYAEIGIAMQLKDAWRTSGWTRERDLASRLLAPGGIALSFGWNSCGMGKSRLFEKIEILLVCHGAGHNDTICVAERKVACQMRMFEEIE